MDRQLDGHVDKYNLPLLLHGNTAIVLISFLLSD